MRLIDADKLWEDTTTNIEDCIEFLEVIERQQTVDAIEHKKGKLIGEPNHAHCSVCKAKNYYAYKYDSDSGLYVQQDFFCPNCGADMRGE